MFDRDRTHGADEPDAAALLDAASRGDEESISELLRPHLDPILAFVRRRMGARLLARERPSDIVQSACLEVLRALPRSGFGGEEEFRGWLYRAAARKVMERGRFHQAERRSPSREEVETLSREVSESQGPSGRVLQQEDRERLAGAFEQLSPEQQQVIRLRFFEGLESHEFAAALGRSPEAARAFLCRSMAKLAILANRGNPP